MILSSVKKIEEIFSCSTLFLGIRKITFLIIEAVKWGTVPPICNFVKSKNINAKNKNFKLYLLGKFKVKIPELDALNLPFL
ncbi:Uncharacterised protein (plasmid) [Mesomycoplasma hyorhinis]|nr:Uncharacterised protein [Mesomycoplasma hyorhinis]